MKHEDYVAECRFPGTSERVTIASFPVSNPESKLRMEGGLLLVHLTGFEPVTFGSVGAWM